MILREELTRRMTANSNYSLRSFAKQLDIDPSLLSKMMNNTRPMSTTAATTVLKKLKLGEAEKNLFWKSFLKSKEDSLKGEKPELTETQFEDNLLEQELFQIIANPLHYTIVELSRLKAFKSDPIWIGEALNISAKEAQGMIDRLIQVGMLKVENEQIKRMPGRFTTKDKTISDSAHKYHQKKILEKAIEALDHIPLEKRNQSSMTIAVNPNKVTLAKSMIHDFINQLSDVLETDQLEEVYQISLSLFPLYQKSDKAQV